MANITIRRYNLSNQEWDAIYPKTTAGNIISGILAAERIPNLNASKINAGKFTADRIPDLDADKITSGTIHANRLPAIALTNVTTTASWAGFLSLYMENTEPPLVEEGDVIIDTTASITRIHNGGTAFTASDFSVLASPTEVTASSIGLGNVNNTSDANKPVSTATQTALDKKLDKNTAITGGTGTKITYDAKGLVTGSSSLTSVDIPSIPGSKINSELSVNVIPTLGMNKIEGLLGNLALKQNIINIVASSAVPEGGWKNGDIIFDPS